MNCQKLTSVTIEGEPTRIGDYAFYNTGISEITIADTVKYIGDYAFAYCANLNNVYIPIMDLMEFGNYCFAYCTSLSDVAFEDYTPAKAANYPSLGSHMFYNCSSLTQVVLPTKFRISKADQYSYLRYGYTSNMSGAVPSYMFAGTAIVEAVLPVSVDYYYTDGVFAGCKKLEKIIMTDQPSNYSKTQGGYVNASWVDGCDNFQYFYTEYSASNSAFVFAVLSNGGITEFHMGTLLDVEKYTEISAGAPLSYTNANLRVYIEKQTWQELIPCFASVTNPWTMQLFDKDGNQLVCSEDDGTVAYVLDKNGNKIWEASYE